MSRATTPRSAPGICKSQRWLRTGDLAAPPRLAALGSSSWHSLGDRSAESQRHMEPGFTNKYIYIYMYYM